MYLLGLVSCTDRGRQTLEQLAWDTPVHVRCNVCLPRDITTSPFFQVTFRFEFELVGLIHSQVEQANNDTNGMHDSIKATSQSKGDMATDILTWIGNLGNHIVAERAMINLKRYAHTNKQKPLVQH